MWEKRLSCVVLWVMGLLVQTNPPPPPEEKDDPADPSTSTVDAAEVRVKWTSKECGWFDAVVEDYQKPWLR
jgi:hypothetical protein